jgi:hypothetical protein
MKTEFETQVAREGAGSRHQAQVNRVLTEAQRLSAAGVE